MKLCTLEVRTDHFHQFSIHYTLLEKLYIFRTRWSNKGVDTWLESWICMARTDVNLLEECNLDIVTLPTMKGMPIRVYRWATKRKKINDHPSATQNMNGKGEQHITSLGVIVMRTKGLCLCKRAQSELMFVEILPDG